MTIKLQNGLEAILDDDDYERFKHLRWYAWKAKHPGATWYVLTANSKRMHRLILNLTDLKLEVDHINGNGLDNRKTNLRVVTHSQNTKNAKKSVRNTSGHKGVTWYKAGNCWRSQIQVDKVKMHLGYFKDLLEAAIAYKTAAELYFGEYNRKDE